MTSPKGKRIHDLKMVYSDFKTILKLLKANHPFEEPERSRIFAQLEKSLSVLDGEIRQIEKEG